MLTHALKHIDEIGVRIDPLQPARDDEALDDADVFRAELGPAEVPRLAPHGDLPERALEVIGIHRDIRIGEEHRQPRTTRERAYSSAPVNAVGGFKPCSSNLRSIQSKKVSTRGFECFSRCSRLASPLSFFSRISSSMS
jgi:hypothetical protein